MNKKDEINSSFAFFVAGLSSKAAPEEVQAFFANCGSVRLLRLRTNQKGSSLSFSNPQNNIRRGFCVIEALDQQTYCNLQECSGLLFKGRKLAVTKLRDHNEFIEYSVDLLKRKVIMTGVPKFFSPKALIGFLEQKFEKVKRLNTLKSLQYKSPGPSTFYKEYLIEFLNQAGAKKATDIQTVSLSWKGKSYDCIFLSYEKRREFYFEDRKYQYLEKKSLKYNDPKLNFWKKEQKIQEINLFRNKQGFLQSNEQSIYTSFELHHLKPSSLKYHLSMKLGEKFPVFHNESKEALQLRFNILKILKKN